MESSSAPRTKNDSSARGRARLSLRVLETLFIGAAGGLVFTAAHFPAGPMIFCAAAALLGRSLDVPQPLARGFSVIVGIALGGLVDPTALRGIAAWPVSIALVALATTCVAIATTTYLRRVHGWDRMTALFAGYPGALAQVMAHAAEEDCDLRAIAIVQMVRVAILTIAVPVALAIIGFRPGAVAVAAAGFADAPGESALLVVAAMAAGLGLVRLGLTGGLLIGPMTVSAILHGSGLISTGLPRWLTVLGMIGIGATGGSRFASAPARLVFAYLGAALGSFAISLGVAAAFGVAASLLIAEPAADIAVAYPPGAIDAMMALALALDLDPIFVGARHLARLFGLSLALPIAIGSVRRAGRKPNR